MISIPCAYSVMIVMSSQFPKISTLLLLMVLAITACTHSAKTDPEELENTPAKAAQSEDSVGQPTAQEDPTELPVIETLAPSQDITEPSIQQQPVAVDLLTRIRNGFALPNYNSPHTGDYERWNSQHPTYLKNLFTRAEPFLYYIVQELEARNMPLDLALLPAVESAFKPEAYSRSAAAGLWQFIPLTARHFKLEKDWWYDGRLDVIRATDAALTYLQQLNTMFDGDWFLTLAAYNAGQGTVRRAITKNKRKGRGTAYQDLDLRAETIRYVPKLMALRNILLHPEQFGVTLPAIPNRPYFVALELAGQTDIHDFAMRSGIDLAELNHLNAGHLRWATSPNGPNRLLVPLFDEYNAQKALDELAKLPPIRFKEHKIGRGETLSGIARRYGVSVAALQQANDLSNTRIRSGKMLMIPIAANSTTTPLPAGETKVVHRVEAGDTLWSIAKRYQVGVEQLRSWNQLSIGQILNLNQALTVFVN